MLNTGKDLVDIGPYKVERDVLEIIQRLYDYDPNVEVVMLDPSRAEFMDAPYMLVENCKDGFQRKIFEVWELNETVLERLYKCDLSRRNVLEEMDKYNAQVRRDAQRRYEEEREEMKDVLKHILKSPKGQYSFPNANGEIVTVDSHRGII